MANAKDKGTGRAASKKKRLSSDRQNELLDQPLQRRAYADLRAAAAGLHDMGYNRLGPRLHEALDRFLSSLPEPFEDARTHLVWREGQSLRRLYRTHLMVDEDEIVSHDGRLEMVVGIQLGDLVELFNYFTFHDEGLRALDEAQRAPPERDLLVDEAKLLKQLKIIVGESGKAQGFDAAEWLSRWLREPLPALGGETPLRFLSTMEGHALVSNALARIQSGAYA